MKKTVFFSLLAIMLVFGFLGCKDESESDPRENFYGTWINSGSHSTDHTMVISRNNFTLTSSGGATISVQNPTWVEENNPSTATNQGKNNYPKGYRLSGDIVSSFAPPYFTNHNYFAIYLHNDKKSIVFNSWALDPDPNEGIDGAIGANVWNRIYIKQ